MRQWVQVTGVFSIVLLAMALGAHGSEHGGSDSDPPALFLTWQQDPTSTMTIDWHTEPADGEDISESLVYYKQVGGEDWERVEGEHHDFPFSDRIIHRVELTGLDASTYYRFRVGDFERAYKFRTIPTEVTEPVRLMAGGDLLGLRREPMRQMNRVAMQFDPDFIVWGGDLAYANGNPLRINRWYEWFGAIRETLISEEGRVVPILVTLGNHEVFMRSRLPRLGYAEDEEEANAMAEEWGLEDDQATFFFDLFAIPQPPGYDVVDFGDYMSIFLLDSDHGQEGQVAGPQAEWLEEALAARSDRPHLFPIYHVPGYPSVRGFGGRTSRRIREHWVPLFERYNVRAAFENHDHTYKRTYPVRDNQISADGIVYIGDGSWGVGPRQPVTGEEAEERLLKKTDARLQGVVVTLHGPHQHFMMVDKEGNIFDEYPATSGTPDSVDVPGPPPPAAVRDRIGEDAERAETIDLPTEGWRLRLDPDAQGESASWYASDLDESNWDSIAIEQTWDEAGYDHTGKAWYRLTLDLPAEMPGEAAVLAFTRVEEIADIWVNGEYLGQYDPWPEEWRGPFEKDVTDHLHWGEDNQITVRIENTVYDGGIDRPIAIEVYTSTD